VLGVVPTYRAYLGYVHLSHACARGYARAFATLFVDKIDHNFTFVFLSLSSSIHSAKLTCSSLPRTLSIDSVVIEKPPSHYVLALLLAHQYRPIGIKTDPIVHDVLATLDVIIGCATLGTIFIQEEVLSNNEKILYSSP